LIIRVKNDKILVHGQQVRLAAQDPAADGMEGSQPQTVCLLAYQFLHPFVHLPGSFVRKSYCQDPIGWHVQGSDQIGNTVGQYARFAGARSRQNKGWSCWSRYSLLLLGIEKIEQVIHRQMIVPKGLKSREGA